MVCRDHRPGPFGRETCRLTSGSVELEPLSVAVAGGRLAAFRYRPDQDAAAPQEAPIVLAAHGITSSSRAWVPVARALGSRAQLIAVDLRGRGDSRDLPAPYGLDVHVADLLTVADDLGLERTILAGHSLGAYAVARLAELHPDRVSALVLVDGGLPIPGSQGVDPQQFATALLGPALARLDLSFPSLAAYSEWWAMHPALRDGQAEAEDIRAYAEHDLAGEPPELRPSVSRAAVSADAEDLVTLAGSALAMAAPATLLVAPRGLQNEPDRPMQPFELAEAWAAQDAERREARLVEDVNHYTITLGKGAPSVAEAMAAYAAAPDRA